jgi:formylglycine-generating enzyme required for sulfatase activity
LHNQFGKSAGELWVLIRQRPDLAELFGSGWISVSSPEERAETVIFLVTEGYSLSSQNAELRGAMLWALDSTAHQHRQYEKVRERFLEAMRQANPPPAISANDWVLIRPGIAGMPESFEMGCNRNFEVEERCRQGEDAHIVTLSPYRILRHEVTVEEYLAFDPKHNQRFNAASLPVAEVSWYEAYAFAAWIGGSLPTEAQWEYAARAGTRTAWSIGNNPDSLKDVAWYNLGSTGNAQEKEKKSANPWGIYDLYGNVSEWCRDWYGPITEEQQTNPTGPQQGTQRVVRGGNWSSTEPWSLRSAARFYNMPSDRFDFLGFRVVLAAN